MTCTKRKRFPVVPGLRMREVHAADIRTGFSTWIERLSTGEAETAPAKHLYAGEHWSIVRSLEDVAASAGLKATVWICSAGYGLIGLDSRIKPYSATFASHDADTVCKWRRDRFASPPAETDRTPSHSWWDLQTQWRGPEPCRPRSIADVAAASPTSSLLIVASHTYLRAMAEDIRRAVGMLTDSDLMCIISAGTKHLPSLDTHLLPATAALQASQVGGSLQSLGSRLARQALSESRGEPPRLSSLRACFAARLGAAPPILRPQREPMTDDQIRTYIVNGLAQDPTVSWTSLLRRLRTRDQRACGQERFAFLFRAVSRRRGCPDLRRST
ncbi:hypothetical protein NKDENANG_03736 [Candidatus Entotheonellaceae bacterium PAL068K]